ncbi:MAG: hypothetical protein ACOYOK_01200 [Pseudobdellovibrionaceae bacterium]
MNIPTKNDLFTDLNKQNPLSNEPQKRPDFLATKNAIRMHYEAEVAVIKKQIGDLEDIRLKLGLSQRKICQLLLVDPSCWTRWLKKQESVPPSVWRSLQWYLALEEKIPGLNAHYFFAWNADHKKGQQQKQLQESLAIQNKTLQQQIKDAEEKQNAFWQWRLQDTQMKWKNEVLQMESRIKKHRNIFIVSILLIFICALIFALRLTYNQG